jgi:hypothetical protein
MAGMLKNNNSQMKNNLQLAGLSLEEFRKLIKIVHQAPTI